MNIAIIGAGTYGSYIADALLKKYPETKITVFEVGGAKVVSELQIGYFSSLKKSLYKGLTDGRWFGFGGASAKWGGQLLTFTENDFLNPDSFMLDVIKYNKKYKAAMLRKFSIENNFSENQVGEGLFTKTGVWLSVFGRNFFKVFKINKRKNITILKNTRVSHIVSSNKKHISSISYIQDDKEFTGEYDYYFLAAGAFENARILLSSKLLAETKVKFSDHLSQKVFKIKKGTLVGNEDFVFRMRGTSLITKRLIGEVNDCSFYAHPVFNMDFPFFQSLKEILFKGKFSFSAINNIFVDIPQVLGFAWSVIVLRRMYVLDNEWFLYIDIENPSKESYVTLSEEKDIFGINGLDVFYKVDQEAAVVFKKAIEVVSKHLRECNVEFDVLAEKIDVETCEDIYHPYGMYCDYKSAEDYFTKYDNMLVVSTGILPRSGGINPTAAVLPLIDEFINNYFQK